MKKVFKSKAIALILVIVVIFTAVLSVCSTLVTDKLSGSKFLERQNIREFYSLPKNTVDVLSIGSSQVLSTFSAPDLYENYGITAFGIGTTNQNFYGAYYWLLEALRFQSPKVLVLEMGGLVREAYSTHFYKNFAEMKNTSKYKFEAAYDLSHNRDYGFTMLEFYSPLYKFHGRWEELEAVDYAFLSGTEKKTYLGNCVNGNIFDQPVLIEDFYVEKTDISDIYKNGEYIESVDDENELSCDVEGLMYLNKILELCRDKGIDVVLYKAPRLAWTSESHSITAEIAKENSLIFVDFNTKEVMDEIEFDVMRDLGDPGHANAFGARKMMKYLGESIVKKYGLESHKNDSKYSVYEAKYNAYLNELNNITINAEKNFADIVGYLGNNDYSVLIAKKGVVSWNDELQKKIEDLGFKSNLSSMSNVALVKVGEKIKLDHISNGSIEKNGYIASGLANYRLYINKGKNKATVRINGKSKSYTADNCLLVSVYDNSQKRTVFSKAFDENLNVLS